MLRNASTIGRSSERANEYLNGEPAAEREWDVHAFLRVTQDYWASFEGPHASAGANCLRKLGVWDAEKLVPLDIIGLSVDARILMDVAHAGGQPFLPILPNGGVARPPS